MTAGYGLRREESFPAQLERLLKLDRPGTSVINAGVSGDTTGQALARLPRLLISQTSKPDLAIVTLGANDIIRGVSVETMRANLDAIIASINDCRIPVLLAGMLMPSFLGRGLAGRYNAVHPELAAKHGAALYPFFLKGVVGDQALLLADRVHPNARAIGIIARNILPSVVKALDGSSHPVARPAA